MDNQLYFEENPWKKACSIVRSGGQNVYQVVIQCVCPQGMTDIYMENWRAAAAELAGDEREGQLLRGAHALSFIGKSGDDTVVRIFVDDGAKDQSENFEIVTDKALFVWKPVSTNQGHLLLQKSEFLQSSQEYTAEL